MIYRIVFLAGVFWAANLFGVERMIFDPAADQVDFYLDMQGLRGQNLSPETTDEGRKVLALTIKDSSRGDRFELIPLKRLYLPDFDKLELKIRVCLPKPGMVNSLHVILKEPTGETFYFQCPVPSDKTGWQTLSFPMDAEKNYRTSTTKYSVNVKVKATDNSKLDFPVYISGIAGFYGKGDGNPQTVLFGPISVDIQENNHPLRPKLETGNSVHVLSAAASTRPGFRVDNVKDRKVSGILAYRVKNSAGQLQEDKEVKVEIEPGETARVEMKRPEKFGVYNIDVTFREAGISQPLTQRMSYCCMMPSGPDSGKAEGFLFGVTSHPQLNLNSVEDETLAAALCGIRILRDDLYWSRYEPVRGQLDFSLFDCTFNAFAKYGIEYQAILPNGKPEWAKAKDWKPLHPEKTGRFYPDPAAWEEFLKSYAVRYGEKIHFTEVMNEPDMIGSGNFSAADYAGLICRSYDTIKAIAPQMKILTGGFACPPSSSSNNLNESDYIAKVLQAAVGKFDILAYHFHCPFVTYVSYMEDLIAVRDKLAPKVPIYPNETAVPSCGGETETSQAEALFTKLIYSWSKGAIGYSWYDLRNDGFDPDYPEHNFGLLTNDCYPKPVYGVFNMLTGYFRHAGFVRRELEHVNCFAFLFRIGAGDFLLPVWTEWNELLILASGVEGKVSEVDLFGNERPLAVNDGKILFKIGRHPSMIRISGQNGPLKFEQAFAVLSPLYAGDDSIVNARHEVVNPTDRDLTLKGGVQTAPGVVCRNKEFSVTVPPHSKRTVSLPFAKETATAGESYRLLLTSPGFSSAELSYQVPAVHRLRKDTVDNAPPVFVVDRPGKVTQLVPNAAETVPLLWKNKDDCSANIYMARTENGLKIKVVVRDDVHCQEFSGKKMWMGDSIQFLFQIPGQPGQFEFGATLNKAGKVERYCWTAPAGFSPREFERAWQVNASHLGKAASCYYTFIPFSLLGIDPAKVESFRFNVLINDNDGTIQESQMGIVNGKNPDQYPVVSLRE